MMEKSNKQNKRTTNIVWKALLITAYLLLICGTICCIAYAIRQADLEEKEQERLELARADIMAQYQFSAIEWVSVEKVESTNGRDDFYLMSALTEDDELRYYMFAVVIREVNNEIDIDTWPVLLYGLEE